MRIGLAYNEKPEPASTEDPDGANDAYAEWDDPATITAVEQALGLFGAVIRLEAGGRGIGQGRVQQQPVRRPGGAAGARPVPGRAIRRAGAGRDVPAGPGIHRRDSRERPRGVLPAGDRVRLLDTAPGRAARIRL